MQIINTQVANQVINQSTIKALYLNTNNLYFLFIFSTPKPKLLYYALESIYHFTEKTTHYFN